MNSHFFIQPFSNLQLSVMPLSLCMCMTASDFVRFCGEDPGYTFSNPLTPELQQVSVMFRGYSLGGTGFNENYRTGFKLTARLSKPR